MAKFQLGRLCASRAVAATMEEQSSFDAFVWQAVARYLRCDWGEMSASDKRANDEAVSSGDARILASYDNLDHPERKIWIITEADRSCTTIIFPDEY